MNTKLPAFLILLSVLAACDSPQPPLPGTASVPDAQPAPVATQTVDPVCGMIRDSTWTDFTVYKGDTVWFCAAIEKKAFVAHPEKYLTGIPSPESNQ